MADRPALRTLFYKLAPRWLTDKGTEGEAVLYSLGLLQDLFVDRLKHGLDARFPERAPEDALPFIGRDRGIVRGRGESAAAYGTRLVRAFDDRQTIGNPYALMDQLHAYLQVDVMLRTVDNRGNWYTRNADGTRAFALNQGDWDWDGAPTLWSRFWVVIYSVGGTPWERLEWGDPALTWGMPGLTWGSTATGDEVRAIRSIVRDWKPAGTRCVNIVIAMDDAAFPAPGAAGLPDGTWGIDHLVPCIPPAVASRDPRCLYWKGTS